MEKVPAGTLILRHADARHVPDPDASRLKRPLQRMSAHVRKALDERGLMAAYKARPAYQRNDWLAWIGRAKREDTKAKRLGSILRELKAGRGYMGMKWEPAKKATKERG